MADTVTTRWVYPPNWSGYYPTVYGPRRYIIRLTSASDGTGETDVRKIIVADHNTSNGETASKLVIERVQCIGFGIEHIKLEFDRTPHETLAVMGDIYDMTYEGGITDNGEGGTGDLLLTTEGATDGGSYDITITYRVK